jgi:tetratricopeptide (TPR) repeat protein
VKPSELEARIRANWNFDDPLGSSAIMAQNAAEAEEPERSIWLTQVARSLSLQDRFDEATNLLDSLAVAGDHHLNARIAIERGRVANSSGDPLRARPLFELALDEARLAGAEGLAIDALHMLAIVAESLPEAARINLEALAQAEASTDPDALRWRGSLLNNLGWAYFDDGKLEQALATFEEALSLRREEGNPQAIRYAEEAVDETRRALGT